LPGAVSANADAMLDPAGALHAVVGGVNDARILGYATDSSGSLTWREVARSVAIPGGQAAAIDRDSRFAVAYLWAAEDDEPASRGWRLGIREADGWSIQSPANAHELSGDSMGLAYDDDGFAHVAYFDRTAQALHHATNAPAGEWRAEQAASGDIYCAAIAWRGGSSGQGHIAYTKFVDCDDDSGLFCAGNESGSWQSAFLGRQSGCPAIAAGADGPHVAYGAEADGQVKHAVKQDGQWETERIELHTADSWPAPAIALDDAGGVHVAYPLKSGEHEGIRYASREGAEWRIEHVDPYHGSQASLALDADGRPHIAFFSEARGRFYYAFLSGPDHWRSSRLDDAYDGAAAIAIDPSGVVHVSYASRLSYWGDSALFHAQFPAGFEVR
jgi:hypothetical protein